MLISALRNLLDNALRYAPQDTAVKLRIEHSGPESIRFAVIDRGPGLSEEDCSQATQRFWRRGIASPGSGLGLSIVSAIARSSGGEFCLYPGAGGGLVAEITLPVSRG